MKFFQYLAMQNNIKTQGVIGATQLGILLILLGIFCLIPGMIEHRKSLNELSEYDGKSRWSYTFIVGIIVGMIGIFALTKAIAIRLY